MFFGLFDGTGTGDKAKVRDGKLFTKGVVEEIAQDALSDGRLYQIGSSLVNLTSSNESAVLFIKNNEDQDLEIVTFSYGGSGMSGGAIDPNDMYTFRLYTGVESISGGVDIPPTNNNLGSSKKLDVISQGGIEGSTLTGGTQSGTTLLPQGDSKRFPLYWILPKGASLCITCQPAAGNTNADINIFFDAYLKKE